MGSHSDFPPSFTSPISYSSGLDHIDIPYDLDALARSENKQARSLPAATVPENTHPYGILNSVHLRLLAGRDAHLTPKMEPAMPALVVRRNDFPAKPASNDEVSHNNTGGGPTLNTDELKGLAHRVLEPTFPPYVEGVVETRHRSDAKTTENLVGFEEELEGIIDSKRENGEKYQAFRTRFSAVQDALAGRAGQFRAVRDVYAEKIRAACYWKDRYPEHLYAERMRRLVARLTRIQRGVKVLAAHMGLVFAYGRAVDQAVLPGNNFGRFDEMACSPKSYLSSTFPEFCRRQPTGPVDPTAPELLPPYLQDLLSPVWDFSLAEVLSQEERATLRDLWAAAVAGDWDGVEDKTRDEIAVVEELLVASAAVAAGA